MSAPYQTPPAGQPGGSPYPTSPVPGPAPTGYPTPTPPPAKNGFAVAALIFGIIAWVPFAIGFGIAGLVRAGKVNKGKAMSWVGIVLAVLWLVPMIIVGTYLGGHLTKALDPGCTAGKAVILGSDQKLNADTNNPDALKKDLATIVGQLNDAAAKSKNSAARDAITKVSADYKELLDDLNNGTQPAGDLVQRAEDDGKAVDTACGTIGS